MNNKGRTETGVVGKILLGLVLVLTLLSVVNNLLIGLSTNSLVRLMSPTSGLGMRIIYVLLSLGTFLTAIILFLKVYINKE